jgi:pimeloyl-ACP methyl ester carboxylesterase
MIHGMWGGAWHWEEWEKFFKAKGFRCLIPPLRHHNVDPKSKPPKGLGCMGLHDYAKDLEEEIKNTNEKPILIGHSMGGLLALMLSGRNLARAAVMITPAPPAGINALTPSVLKSFAGPMLKLKWLGFPHRLSFKASVYAMLHLLSKDEQKYIYERMVYESGRAAREIGFWWADWRMASKVNPDTVDIPLLIISASEDRITPAKVIKKVADKYAHVANYLPYSDHAHFIIRETGWEKLAEDIFQWISKLK